MSEYLDKLARAAVAAYEEGSGMVTPWELLGEHAQNVARNQVRAVLRLLREPSEAMKDAARGGPDRGDDDVEGEWYPFSQGHIWEAYTTMIDKALEE